MGDQPTYSHNFGVDLSNVLSAEPKNFLVSKFCGAIKVTRKTSEDLENGKWEEIFS